MTRIPLLLLSLIAVGAILWVTVFGASGPVPKETPAKPSASSRPARAARKRRIRIAGHVQTREGEPVKGATVFVLPKKRAGIDRSDAAHEVSDAAGRWALWTKRTVGCWIGVVAAGYRNAWLDGDTVDPAVQMFLILDPAEPVMVAMRWPDGRPVSGQGVQVEPWPPQASWYLPGPDARQGEQWGVTNARGELAVHRGTTRPLWLTPQVEGHYSRPAHGWVAGTPAEVTFVILPKADLDVRLTAAGDGAPLAGLVTVAFSDPRTGAPISALTEATEAPGRLTLARALPPGTYDVEIQMEGRTAWFRPDVAIAAGKLPNTISAQLRPAPATTPLTLRLAGNVGVVRPGTRQRAPLVFFDRIDPGTSWSRRGWRPGAPDLWTPDPQTLTFTLAPGTYRVLVADVASGRAALEGDVVLRAGAPLDLDVRMQPGQMGRLPAMREGRVYALDLEASAAGVAHLPVFGGTRDGRLRAARPLGVILRGLEGRKMFVGPYPFDAFTLHVRRSDGTTADVAFR